MVFGVLPNTLKIPVNGKDMRKGIRMSFTRYLLFGLSLCLISGCSTQRNISISTTPKGAEVSITADRNGPTNFKIGETPLLHSFAFNPSGPTMYNVNFSMSGYEPKTISIRKEDQQSDLNIVLDKQVVKEIPKLVVVVSEEKGYVLEKKNVRAWVEDIEREGMAASSIVRLSENQSVIGMDLAPDGKTLYFSLAESLKDENEKIKDIANLRAVLTTGGGIIQVTNGQWLDHTPTCSKDGLYLIFSSNRIQNDKPDLFRISTERTGGIAVIRQTSEGANFEPSVSKGGIVSFTYLPKYQGRLSGVKQIWTLGGENIYPTQLKVGSMSSLSPDGTQLAYIGEDGQLWKMPTSGQNPVQLTSETINKDGKKHPRWSTDGNSIVFASDVGKDNKDVANYDIWIIPSDGGVSRQLTTNGSEDDYPVVSPDQKYIYFISNRGFKEGIWRIPFPEAPTSEK